MRGFPACCLFYISSLGKQTMAATLKQYHNNVAVSLVSRVARCGENPITKRVLGLANFCGMRLFNPLTSMGLHYNFHFLVGVEVRRTSPGERREYGTHNTHTAWRRSSCLRRLCAFFSSIRVRGYHAARSQLWYIS